MEIPEEILQEANDYIKELLNSSNNLASKTELEEQLYVAYKYFIEYDVDSSNTIDFIELKKLCNILCLPLEKNEEEALYKLDTDSSGTLDKMEFIKWWLNRISNLPNPTSQQEAIATAIFKKYDKDNSNTLTKDEILLLFQDLGTNFSDEELDEIIDILDTDNNETIELNEFLEWWKSRILTNRSKNFENMSMMTLKLHALAKKSSEHFTIDIFEAVWKNDIELVRIFLNKEPRLANSTDNSLYGDKWQPLHYASYQGYYDMVSLLLSKGANINATNALGFTPLFYASQQAHYSICELLIENNANPLIEGCDEENYKDMSVCPLDFIKYYPKLKPIFMKSSHCNVDQLDEKEFKQINDHLSNLSEVHLKLIPKKNFFKQKLFIPMNHLKQIIKIPFRNFDMKSKISFSSLYDSNLSLFFNNSNLKFLPNQDMNEVENLFDFEFLNKIPYDSYGSNESFVCNLDPSSAFELLYKYYLSLLFIIKLEDDEGYNSFFNFFLTFQIIYCQIIQLIYSYNDFYNILVAKYRYLGLFSPFSCFEKLLEFNIKKLAPNNKRVLVFYHNFMERKNKFSKRSVVPSELSSNSESMSRSPSSSLLSPLSDSTKGILDIFNNSITSTTSNSTLVGYSDIEKKNESIELMNLTDCCNEIWKSLKNNYPSEPPFKPISKVFSNVSNLIPYFDEFFKMNIPEISYEITLNNSISSIKITNLIKENITSTYDIY